LQMGSPDGQAALFAHSTQKPPAHVGVTPPQSALPEQRAP